MGGHLVAKLNRGVNPRQWLEASAGFMHNDGSIIEKATPKRLINVHALARPTRRRLLQDWRVNPALEESQKKPSRKDQVWVAKLALLRN